MSKSVASIFGKKARKDLEAVTTNWPLPNQLIGIEIEAETGPNTVHPELLAPYWTRHRDGSLITNGAQEYVLAVPLKGKALSEAIANIFDGTRLERSTTGSTHIHLDMTEESTTQEVVQVLVLMIFALESAVFALSDKGREWCGYTNKLMSAPDMLIAAVLNDTEDNDFADLRRVCQDMHNIGRYYGLNLLALAKYGSLEFRYFPTCISEDELTSWVSLVQCFKKAAIAVGTSEQLYRTFENQDLYDVFVSTYFGPWREVFLSEVPQFTAISNLRKALTIAEASKIKDSIFDERAITENKAFSKFVKNKKKTVPSFQYDVIAPGSSRVAEAFERPSGYTIVTVDDMYMSDGRSWIRCPWSSSISALTMAQKRNALNLMTHIHGSGRAQFVTAARNNQWTERQISHYLDVRLVARIADVRIITSQGDATRPLEVPPAPRQQQTTTGRFGPSDQFQFSEIVRQEQERQLAAALRRDAATRMEDDRLLRELTNMAPEVPRAVPVPEPPAPRVRRQRPIPVIRPTFEATSWEETNWDRNPFDPEI